MSLRSSSLAVALLIGAVALTAQGLKVAVMDFNLESDNPQFKYLGKGFTELTSVEVARLRGFTLVDRERRNDILEEQAFALSGAVDESQAMKIGELLTVDYLVVGSIIDMMGGLVVTYSAVKTDTGAVVGKMKTEGQPAEYKRMVREIGAGIASMMGKETAVAKAPPPAAPVAKQAEVLTSFSEAVAALDTKDTKTAQKKLEEAQALDPSDPAVRFYLDKLASGTSKFSVVPEAFYSLSNPASLGLIKEDSLSFTTAFGGTLIFERKLDGVPSGSEILIPGTFGALGPKGPGRFGVSENDFRNRIAYTFPIAEGLGMSAQIVLPFIVGTLQQELYDGANGVGVRPILANFGIGWAPAPWFLVGLGLVGGVNVQTLGYQGLTTSPPPETAAMIGGEAGILFRAGQGRATFGLQAGYSNFYTYQYDMVTLGKGPRLVAPLYFDQTNTVGLGALHDFLVLKTIGYLYPSPDEDATYIQVIPAYQHWFGSSFAIRAGAVASMVPIPSLYMGYGGTLGATLVFGSWEVDLGATYRQRPSRIYSPAIIPEAMLNIGIKKNGILKPRA